MQTDEKKKEEPPPLTKMEKKALKKLQKKMELEKKIREAEISEMDREIKVAKKNIEEYRRKWTEIQMEKGRPEFKEYMTEHWRLFDHLMDRKDHIIEMYTEELEHADRTRRRAHFDHIRMVDSLLDDFKNSIEDMKENIENVKENLIALRNRRVAQFTDETYQVDENMRLILFLIDQKKKKNREVWGGEMVTKLDEEISKYRSEIDLLVAQLEAQLVALWKEYKLILEDYVQDSKRVLKLSVPLMEKVKADDHMIAVEKKKIKFSNRTIDIYKFRAQRQPMFVQLRDLRMERAELADKYIKLKLRKSNWRDQYSDCLKHSVKTNTDVNDYLTKVTTKGMKIIRLSQMCRNLETEGENTELTKSDHYQRPAQEKSFAVEMLKFWKRVGQTTMVEGVLQAQFKKLKKENNMLKNQIRCLMRSPQLQSILKDLKWCSGNSF